MDNAKFKEDIEAVKAYTADSNYEEALDILIKRIREGSRINDQAAVDKYSAMARGILVLVESEYGATRLKPNDSSEQHCSFCGESDASKLIAGAEAMICRSCSENIFSHFNEYKNT
jgi:hypothetical protein